MEVKLCVCSTPDVQHLHVVQLHELTNTVMIENDTCIEDKCPCRVYRPNGQTMKLVMV